MGAIPRGILSCGILYGIPNNVRSNTDSNMGYFVVLECGLVEFDDTVKVKLILFRVTDYEAWMLHVCYSESCVIRKSVKALILPF